MVGRERRQKITREAARQTNRQMKIDRHRQRPTEGWIQTNIGRLMKKMIN